MQHNQVLVQRARFTNQAEDFDEQTALALVAPRPAMLTCSSNGVGRYKSKPTCQVKPDPFMLICGQVPSTAQLHVDALLTADRGICKNQAIDGTAVVRCYMEPDKSSLGPAKYIWLIKVQGCA